MQNEKISLYFSEGGSDKEYHAELLEAEGGFLVNFRYGRRGSALTGGSKTKDPVPYDKAKKVYDKLVAEKRGKGYSTGESGTAYQDTPKEALVTGVLPQLLNPVDEADLERLLKDPAWVMQEKHDGERRMVSNVGGEFFGINRKGLRVALPLPLVNALADLPANSILDSEIIGDTIHVFDLLQLDGDDLRLAAYEDRLDIMSDVLRATDIRHVVPVVTLRSEADKRHTFGLVKSRNGEGVVFKRLAAVYTVGRPNSGGDQLKFKFVESATLFVYGHNEGKRSVQVAAFDGKGGAVILGSVTIPPNYEVPEIGAVVEVEYLYAFPSGGSVYQPVYRGPRTDQSMDDCVVSQLKYKPMAIAA